MTGNNWQSKGLAWFSGIAIAQNDYRARGAEVDADEIFVSGGSKCDSGNILDVFGEDNVIAVLDPVYPVYVDTNVMAGHTGPADTSGRYGGLVYLPVTADNDFVPELPKQKVDLIYLCYPNNPTGVVATKEMLKRWVEYAQQNGSVIRIGNSIKNRKFNRAFESISGFGSRSQS